MDALDNNSKFTLDKKVTRDPVSSLKSTDPGFSQYGSDATGLVFTVNRHEESDPLFKPTNEIRALINEGKNTPSNYFDALDRINGLIKGNPDDALLHNMKGVILHRIGRDNEAIDCFVEALTLRGYRLPDAFYNQACSCVALGMTGRALAALESAVKLDPVFKSKALGDSDFEPLANDATFRGIVS